MQRDRWGQVDGRQQQSCWRHNKAILPGLSFQVRLPDWLPIHPIISIEHLEPARKDPHNRSLPPPRPIHDENGREKYIVDKIHNKEIRSVQNVQGRRLHYKVSHLGYQERNG